MYEYPDRHTFISVFGMQIRVSRCIKTKRNCCALLRIDHIAAVCRHQSCCQCRYLCKNCTFGFVFTCVITVFHFGISIKFLLLLSTSTSSSICCYYFFIYHAHVVQMNPFIEYNAVINEQMK